MVKSINLSMSYNNAIIQSHSIYGQYLMPGLGYIDLFYQLGGKFGIRYETHCIRNLAIENSLIVPKEQQIELLITFEQKGDIWFVQVEDKGQVYAKAQFHLENKDYSEVIDREAQKQKAETVFDMDSVYESARKHELVHTGIMKVSGTCYLNKDQIYIEIEIGEAYRTSKEQYLFHPALIDGAGMAGGTIRGDGEDSQNLYVPLCYEYFYCKERITDRCFVRVLKSSVKEKNEIRSSDIEIYNEEGRKIGELSGVASKKIRMKSQIQLKTKKEEKSQIASRGEKQKKISKPDSKLGESMEQTLKDLFSVYLDMDPQTIENNVGFFELGLESSQLLNLHHDIEEKLGVKLNQTTLFEYTTIQELANRLLELVGKGTKKESGLLNKQIEWEEENSVSQKEDIAIIGMAGYFPEADNIEEFWNNLLEGKDCIKEVPKERWDWHKFEDVKTPTGKPISKWGGFLSDVAGFDAEFFRVSPREAEIIDPQERLFLQCCWKALEDAGYTPENVCKQPGRKAGVYVGVMHKDYALVGLDVMNSGKSVPLSLNYAPIANRVSYFCDFHGPSMAVDTVCSSSLLSIHLAIESIQKGESEVALAGGVNLSLHPAKYLSYGLAGMHSSNGACRTFGTDADGYVSSEGIGAVLLKPLSKAVQDNDNIYAVIKKTAVNHGGRASGLTVPSPVAQGNLIYDCLQQARINPRTIQYVEAHGTGTSLGDPIEIQGLMNAFSKFTDEKQFCSIGSVKSNIGHTESAAGVAGIIKVCLQLYYKMLVPTLHSEELNPILQFEDSAFYVQHKKEHWESNKQEIDGRLTECKRRAAISAFGATGTNVHAILEEYVQPDTLKNKSDSKVCFLLSARNEERLQAYIADYLNFSKKQKEEDFSLEQMAYTMSVGREEFDERFAAVVSSLQELTDILEKALENKTKNLPHVFHGNVRKSDGMIKQLMGREEWEELIEKWVAKENIEQIAKLWVAGVTIDWTKVYKEGGRRISLPTYPFASTPYWLKPNENSVEPENPTVAQKPVHRKLLDIYKKKDSIKKPDMLQEKDSVIMLVENMLKIWLSDELNITKQYIDEEIDIQELGLEQIQAVKIVRLINEKYKIQLETVQLYEAKTIRNIALLIQKTMKEHT